MHKQRKKQEAESDSAETDRMAGGELRSAGSQTLARLKLWAETAWCHVDWALVVIPNIHTHTVTEHTLTKAAANPPIKLKVSHIQAGECGSQTDEIRLLILRKSKIKTI